MNKRTVMRYTLYWVHGVTEISRNIDYPYDSYQKACQPSNRVPANMPLFCDRSSSLVEVIHANPTERD